MASANFLYACPSSFRPPTGSPTSRRERIPPTRWDGRSRSSPRTTCSSRTPPMRPGSSSADHRLRPPIRPAGSRSSSFPRTPDAGGEACRSRSRRMRIRPSGSKSTSRRRARPASTAARFRCRPTTRGGVCRSNCRFSILPFRTRTACTRCCFTRANRPSSTTVATWMRSTTDSRTAIASSSCTPTTRNACRKPGDDFPARISQRLRGTRVPEPVWATSLSRGRSTAPAPTSTTAPQPGR